jgi:hypothetical protein
MHQRTKTIILYDFALFADGRGDSRHPGFITSGWQFREASPLSPAKRPELRVGCAVAQRGIFHAEGSFEL